MPERRRPSRRSAAEQVRDRLRRPQPARGQAVPRRRWSEWYGKERAEKVQYAEAFEVCEYGRRPNKAELARLFPFFGQ